MADLLRPTISAWLDDLDRQSKSALTCTGYRCALANFVHWWSKQAYGQPLDASAIIPRNVADWKAFQQTVKGAKPATINQRLVAVSRFFKWATAHGHVRGDPAAEVRGLRLEAGRLKALDDVALTASPARHFIAILLGCLISKSRNKPTCQQTNAAHLARRRVWWKMELAKQRSDLGERNPLVAVSLRQFSRTDSKPLIILEDDGKIERMLLHLFPNLLSCFADVLV